MSKMSDTGIDAQQRAHETREVTLTLRLPPKLADQVEEIHATEPEFLERVVRYGLTRRGLLFRLLERERERAEADKSHTAEEA